MKWNKIDCCYHCILYTYRMKRRAIALSPVAVAAAAPASIKRLNYIGSKYQLLDWLTSVMKEKTGWSDFSDKIVADLFAGTGVVAFHFRTSHAATVLSNDVEYYSSIITHAGTRSVYSDTTDRVISEMNKDIREGKHADGAPGFVTRHYSPYEANERMFFTVENARRIDYVRGKLEELRLSITDDDYNFILASIIISADSVSNVPAVYGCYLKSFKPKATKPLVIFPIHTITEGSNPESTTYNMDVLDPAFLGGLASSDIVYLDPPYNERQYSKNYFPLNIIAKNPEELMSDKMKPLKGKTGIPADCFLSPFCKKGAPVETAFDTLFRELKTKWIFLSYSSESIVSKDRMIELMEKYGEVSVVERDYKRFKSFEYNEDKSIQEYLFCLKKSATATAPIVKGP